METELKRILKRIKWYGQRGHIEELSYMSGAALEELRRLGCPIPDNLITEITRIVDQWCNSKDAPERDPVKRTA